MEIYHRKLHPDQVDPEELCVSYCHPTADQSGFCPELCLPLCSDFCHWPIPDITPPDLPSPNPSKLHKLSSSVIIALSVTTSTFILIFCLALYLRNNSRWRRTGARSERSSDDQEIRDDQFIGEDHGPMLEHPIWYIRTAGLEPEVIGAITVCKYKRGNGLVEGTDCAVCLSEFQEDETLRLLPKCSHAFHVPCIDTWLRSHTNCPICRAGIVTDVAPVQSPAPDPVVEGSGPGGEFAEIEGVSDAGGVRRETEDGNCELLSETEEAAIVVEEVEPRRRSISMDSLSVSTSLVLTNTVVGVEATGNSDSQSVKLNKSNPGGGRKSSGNHGSQSLRRFMGSSSRGRSSSLQLGPISMKRSRSSDAN